MQRGRNYTAIGTDWQGHVLCVVALKNGWPAMHSRMTTRSTRSDALANPIRARWPFWPWGQHRLGCSDEARQFLDRLRQLLQQDRWKNDTDSQAFLREAESVSNLPLPDS